MLNIRRHGIEIIVPEKCQMAFCTEGGDSVFLIRGARERSACTHLLRAVSGSDMCKFSVMTLRRMALPPAFHLLLPLQEGKRGHEPLEPDRREHCPLNGPQERGCLGDGPYTTTPAPALGRQWAALLFEPMSLSPCNSSHTSMLIDTVHW